MTRLHSELLNWKWLTQNTACVRVCMHSLYMYYNVGFTSTKYSPTCLCPVHSTFSFSLYLKVTLQILGRKFYKNTKK